jgi:hypothetical protein
MSYLVFGIMFNQYVWVLKFLLFSLRNSKLMVKTWVTAKTISIRGLFKYPWWWSQYIYGKNNKWLKRALNSRNKDVCSWVLSWLML